MICNAQLSVKSTKSDIEKIDSARAGLVRLMKHSDLYYITSPSSNQFDDPFIIYLGEGVESAILTTKDLISLFATLKKDCVTIQNGKEECRIYKGMGTIDFHQDDYAGYCTLMKMELQKFLKTLESMEE